MTILVHVNGNGCEVAARDLAAALHELGYADSVVATALNGEFVPRTERAAMTLAAGDRIEIVAPMQGG